MDLGEAAGRTEEAGEECSASSVVVSRSVLASSGSEAESTSLERVGWVEGGDSRKGELSTGPGVSLGRRGWWWW